MIYPRCLTLMCLTSWLGGEIDLRLMGWVMGGVDDLSTSMIMVIFIKSKLYRQQVLDHIPRLSNGVVSHNHGGCGTASESGHSARGPRCQRLKPESPIALWALLGPPGKVIRRLGDIR